MITTASLKTQSWKDLAEMAKSKGLPGWSAMRKNDLVKALARAAKLRRAKAAKVSSTKVAKPARASAVRATHGKAHQPSRGVKLNGSAKSHASAKSGVTKLNGTSPHNGSSKVHVATKTRIVPKAAAPVKTIHSAKSSSVKAVAKSTNGVASKASGSAKTLVSAKSNGTAKTNGALHHADRPPVRQNKAIERIHKAHVERERLKDLSSAVAFRSKSGAKRNTAADRDRLVLLVRDPYWLQACWNVTRQSVKRAEAALAEHWHTAQPILRLLEVDGGHTTSTSERVAREIEIHGGVTNWYIELSNPPQSYRVEIGYRAGNGKFFAICRSNAVSTPSPDSSDVIDENWTDVAENYERIYAMSGGYSDDNNGGELQELFEERLLRPMNSPASSQFGGGAERILHKQREMEFNVDAEMILYGRTRSDAKVTLAGDPIKLRPDGTFTVRLAMPDKRQVLPVVASSTDGVEQRTIVIAVERNTKVLEPMLRESNE